ncbi:Hypothetical protein FKW44_008724 [Caligus rogercresseyi]|uniref:Uncharacterized protein n=1 Tax=Caligus rogercresseyi TaxID=217165 RepID=A0A7T8KGJ1_CALRO|nr:Hypothetical protein FKW44_008724 [Caligus rogercresseyi]
MSISSSPPPCKIVLPTHINSILSAVKTHGDTLHGVMSNYLIRYGKLLSRSMRLKKSLEDFAISSNISSKESGAPEELLELSDD